MDGTFVEPAYLAYKLEKEIPGNDSETRTLELEMEVLVGMTESSWKNDAGAWMWGNNRLFAQSVTKEIFGKGGPGHMSINSQATTRVFVFVQFKAENPRDIPWGSPIKWSYNDQHEAASWVGKHLRDAAFRYIQLASVAGGKGLINLLQRGVEDDGDGAGDGI